MYFHDNYVHFPLHILITMINQKIKDRGSESYYLTDKVNTSRQACHFQTKLSMIFSSYLHHWFPGWHRSSDFQTSWAEKAWTKLTKQFKHGAISIPLRAGDIWFIFNEHKTNFPEIYFRKKVYKWGLIFYFSYIFNK